jgi:hypothetical protein
MLRDIKDDSDDYENHAEATFDFDFTVSTIQEFDTNFRPQSTPISNNTKVRIPSNKWFGLDKSSLLNWGQLDDKVKSIIPGYTTPNLSRRTAPSKEVGGKPPFKSSFNRQASLHDISSYDFLLANMHDDLISDDTPNEYPVDFEEPPQS